MPSSLQGGVWRLSLSWAIWGEKSPEKKFLNEFGDNLLCFRMLLTRFGLSRTEFGSLITLHEAYRCLVACKGGGVGDLAVFGRFGVKNDRKKKVSKCVWGCFRGAFMIFSDGVDAFWAL